MSPFARARARLQDRRPKLRPRIRARARGTTSDGVPRPHILGETASSCTEEASKWGHLGGVQGPGGRGRCCRPSRARARDYNTEGSGVHGPETPHHLYHGPRPHLTSQGPRARWPLPYLRAVLPEAPAADRRDAGAPAEEARRRHAPTRCLRARRPGRRPPCPKGTDEGRSPGCTECIT